MKTNSIFRRNEPVVEIHHPSNRCKEVNPLLQFFHGDCFTMQFIYFDCDEQFYDLSETDIRVPVFQSKEDCDPIFTLSSVGGSVNIESPECGFFKVTIDEDQSEELTAGYKPFCVELVQPCKTTILSSMFEILEKKRKIDAPFKVMV